ncbi:hypothetical protein L211DRAFT_869325 [Terfezia boudieri ATCC MYA-4762]|uniref:RING-type domain-containing protein n=1 Tax=Terfezia boudieri ATCC MYA-4762 TaxID=1051890 RepID=A0A3N4LWB4_9PEZI|nr:hypothetical protein L211DRAFT_869325 [Terfezia boudieri ATCC MYA-4762]
MPSRPNKTQGKATAQPPGAGPSTTTSRSTLRLTSWGEVGSSYDQIRPAAGLTPALPLRASIGPIVTTCTTEPDPALIENLSRCIRSFFTFLFIASPYTYTEHLRSLQLSLETHLRKHYTSIRSDATWERIFGWCPNRNPETAFEELLYLQIPSYSLPPATCFSTSSELPVTWQGIGIEARTQKRYVSSETAPVHGRAPPTASSRLHMPQTLRNTRVSAATTANTYTTSRTNGSGSHVSMGSQLTRPGEASRSTAFSSTIGAVPARTRPEHQRHPPGSASLVNVPANIGCRRRQRPALRVEQSPSRMNSNSHHVDDLLSESEFSISDDDGDNLDDDDGDYVDIRNFAYRYRIQVSCADGGNRNDFPALPTAAPAAQLGHHITPLHEPPLAIPTAAPAQPLHPDLATATRKLAEETSVLLESYSRSTSENEQQNYETIRTALDSVHKIWDRLLRAGRVNGASYSGAVVGSTIGDCTWGGRTASESKSDQTFRPYSACIICYNAVADTVLMPCHHLVLCLECCNIMGISERALTWSVLVREGRVPDTMKCPLCRAVVSHRIKIYRG